MFSKKTLYFLPFLALLLLADVMGMRLLAEKHETENAAVVTALKPAPVLKGPMHPENNTPFTDANFKGRYTVVNFFASWCIVCIKEHHLIKELSDIYNQKIYI